MDEGQLQVGSSEEGSLYKGYIRLKGASSGLYTRYRAYVRLAPPLVTHLLQLF